MLEWETCKVLVLKNSIQFPLAIGEYPSEKRLRQHESELFDG